MTIRTSTSDGSSGGVVITTSNSGGGFTRMPSPFDPGGRISMERQTEIEIEIHEQALQAIILETARLAQWNSHGPGSEWRITWCPNCDPELLDPLFFLNVEAMKGWREAHWRTGGTHMLEPAWVNAMTRVREDGTIDARMGMREIGGVTRAPLDSDDDEDWSF